MPKNAFGSRASTLYELDARTRRPDVLLAEDDEPFRRLIATALRRDGFEVAEARTGRELLTMVAARMQRGIDPFDLVITDIRMPVMSGLDAIAGLRSADWATAIIVITAFGDDLTRAEARRLGAQAMFSKPFDLVDLRTAASHFARG